VRFFILQLVAVFGLAGILWAEDLTSISLSSNEEAEVKQWLQSYEKGTLTEQQLELVKRGGVKWDQKLIAYYLSHTNDVTVRMKLAVSRSFFAFDKYQETAKLAADYVQVYTNDSRGWANLGAANFAMHNFNAAIGAFTNATRLGDDGSYAPLAFAALETDRLDIVQKIIPKLLDLKSTKATQEISSLDATTALVYYSLKANQQDIFVKALQGVDVKQILSRDDLKQCVEIGCDQFKGKDIDKIRQNLEAASRNDSKTNAVSNPSP
jgi:hypothetical protein